MIKKSIKNCYKTDLITDSNAIFKHSKAVRKNWDWVLGACQVLFQDVYVFLEFYEIFLVKSLAYQKRESQ